MEAKEKQQKKPSMDEMQRYLISVTNENKELKQRLNESFNVIDSLQTQNLFSYINFAQKVMDHPEMYEEDFVNQMSKDIETMMMRLHLAMVERVNSNEDGESENTKEA